MLRLVKRDVALATVVIFGVVAVVSLAPPPAATQFSAASHDFGHVVVFGALGLVLARTLRRLAPQRAPWPVVALATLAAGLGFGIATEFAQGYLGGVASWGDVGRDMLGAALGLCAAIALERPTAPRLRRLLWLTVASGLLAAAAPLVSTTLDYRARDALFPVLLDPGAPRALAFISAFGETIALEPLPPGLLEAPGESRPAASAPAQALRVALERGPWPGITLAEPAPDWRGWRALVVEVANPGDAPLDLSTRVNDRDHDNRYQDRFNGYLSLPPRSRGRFEFPIEAIERAPDGRIMDLSRIEKIVVFHGGPAPGRSFHLERIALVR